MAGCWPAWANLPVPRTFTANIITQGPAMTHSPGLQHIHCAAMGRQPKTDRVFHHTSSVVRGRILIGQSVDTASGPASASINQSRVSTAAQSPHPTPKPVRACQSLPEPASCLHQPGVLFLFASTDSTAVCLETSAPQPRCPNGSPIEAQLSR